MNDASPSPAATPLPGLLLAGTDTGVGKTTVGRALLRLARRRGLRLLPFKPVETGCTDGHPGDAAALLEASAVPDLSLSEVCPNPFASPVSPSVAARLERRPLSLLDLARRARHLASTADALLVEGAGGLLSPWGPDLNAATLAAHLRLPVLIVAANRLGTINHTVLVSSECRRRGLTCTGFVLVDVSPTATPDRDTNATEIARESGLQPLGVLGHFPHPDTDALADLASAQLDVESIFRILSGAAVPLPDSSRP